MHVINVAAMNLEERINLQERIHRLEGLLAYAEQTNDEPEIARLRAELAAAVEQCISPERVKRESRSDGYQGCDGCCCC